MTDFTRHGSSPIWKIESAIKGFTKSWWSQNQVWQKLHLIINYFSGVIHVFEYFCHGIQSWNTTPTTCFTLICQGKMCFGVNVLKPRQDRCLNTILESNSKLYRFLQEYYYRPSTSHVAVIQHLYISQNTFEVSTITLNWHIRYFVLGAIAQRGFIFC